MSPKSKKRVVVVEPGKIPVVREIDGWDEAVRIIGGNVERVRMGKYDCLCDEDGLSKKLPPNRMINAGQMIVGTFVVTKLWSGGFDSLTESEASWLVRDLVEWAPTTSLEVPR